MKDTEHAKKVREAAIKKHGSLEAWSEFQRQSGNKAKRSHEGGFAYLKLHDPEGHKQLSSLGGKRSKRYGKGTFNTGDY